MMRRNIFTFILGSGWLFLLLFLISGYFYNKLANISNGFVLTPVAWENHMQLFDGAIQCSLTESALLERKELLQQTIFSKVRERKESLNGITYYFKDNDELLGSVLTYVKLEKACCPFFKFDISILPFDKGFAFQVSGSQAAIEMLKEFESGSL